MKLYYYKMFYYAGESGHTHSRNSNIDNSNGKVDVDVGIRAGTSKEDYVQRVHVDSQGRF